MDIDFEKPGPRLIAKIGGVVLVIGALLDTFSNAVSIISHNVTYIGTIVTLLFLPTIWVLEKENILTLRHHGGKILYPYNRQIFVWVVGLLLVLWLPRIFETSPRATSDLLTQREVLEIQGTKIYEVFYPRPFSSVPNLNFNKKIDNVYFYVDYDVVEQRPDGFKINVMSTQSDAALEWIAVGVVDKKLATTK